MSKKYLATSTAQASVFSNPKLRVHIEDGFEFLRKCARHAKAVAAGDASGSGVEDPDVPADGLFDVIITDCTDAVEGSPGEALYEAQFYELISGALRPDGISCALGECLLDLTIIEFTNSYFYIKFPLFNLTYLS